MMGLVWGLLWLISILFFCVKVLLLTIRSAGPQCTVCKTWRMCDNKSAGIVNTRSVSCAVVPS